MGKVYKAILEHEREGFYLANRPADSSRHDVNQGMVSMKFRERLQADID